MLLYSMIFSALALVVDGGAFALDNSVDRRSLKPEGDNVERHGTPKHGGAESLQVFGDDGGFYYFAPNGKKVRLGSEPFSPVPAEMSYVDKLRSRLTHKDILVCKHAALALGELRANAVSAVPDLRKLLVHSDDQVCIAAARALDMILDSASRDPMKPDNR